MRRLAGLSALAIAATTVFAGLVGMAPAHAAEGDLELVLAPENGALSRPGEALTVSGTVTNVSGAPVPAGTLDVAVARSLASRDALNEAFADPSTVSASVVGTVDTPPLPVLGSAQLSVQIPADVLDGALSGGGWGAHVVVTTMRAGDDLTVASASALVRLDGTAPTTLDVSVVVPITTPASGEGLISAESLEQYTAPSGLLTRKLEAASNPAATVLLDPRILASIRVLGISAPESALQWLEQLEALPNPVIPLQYADSDISLERSIGASIPLTPTSFLAALDPDNFPATEPTPSPDASAATTSPTPSPSPTSTATQEPTPAVTLPTLEELLAFDYSATDLAWPSAGHSTTADLDFAAAGGLNRVLVGAEDLDGPITGDVASVDSHNVIVADASSSIVSDAVFAVGSTDTRLAQSRATAVLAATATDTGSSRRSVVVALDRARSTGTDMAGPLQALTSLPWISVDSFPAADAVADAGAQWATAADDRVDTARGLLTDEEAISRFSSILDQPELLTGPARNDLLAGLSAGWIDDPDGWRGAVAATRADTAATLASVTVDASSQINVAAFTAEAPIYVSNALPYPVNVVVTPQANNGRLVITGATSTIQPASTQRVLLQAKAIANGRVTVTVNLSSPSGAPIGTPRYIQLDVQPFWETAGIAVIGALVLALLGFGTYRSIRRRRRLRAEPADA
ncbi:DUF6049 family protein [Amnibacterium flavum]|uniref:2-oxoglutarate dehydrogenase n=1 Tax=Amnibacterium flavum TaxID=2173173 RepID=A0A2V1HWF7_9MICO|nr:DUF6049 family protein [Amnibacterium flavum]PVZ95470.1 hypothetical protein DDQ50_02885 [Amnibacterium flavum]